MSYAPAGNQTGTSGINHGATVWYNRRALDQLKKRFRFYNACEPDMIPRRVGKTVQWFRYNLLAANTSAAPEGAVGTSNTLGSTTISGSVTEYSDFITVSTLMDETFIDPVVQNAAEQLGYSAGLSVDTIIKAEFDTNSGAVLSPGTLGTYATVDDLRRSKALLEGADVRPKDERFYYAIIHPYIVYDIKSDSTAGGFIDLMKAAYMGHGEQSEFINTSNPFDEPVGIVENIKIWATTNVTTSGSAPNVLYSSYVVGRGAVGAVDLQGSGPSKVEDPTKQQFRINVIRGGPQIADPAGMIGAAVSYRYVFLAKTLDATNFRYRIFKADASLV
jgi:N4-gp56 family major capsid protein